MISITLKQKPNMIHRFTEIICSISWAYKSFFRLAVQKLNNFSIRFGRKSVCSKQYILINRHYILYFAKKPVWKIIIRNIELRISNYIIGYSYALVKPIKFVKHIFKPRNFNKHISKQQGLFGV